MRDILSLLVFTMIFVSCASDKKLDEKTALKLIKEEKGYPKVVEYEIYTADPQDAKKLLDLGLEKEGLITVQKTQASADVGRPLIMFTKKAQPFLLSQTIDDKKAKIQRVKIADEVVKSITRITEQEDGNGVVVEFETSFENVSAFSVLSGVKLNKTRNLNVNVVFDDNVWSLN
jgi:hypothetical protein